MRISMVSFLMILTTVFLSGCTKSEHQMAALEDRSGNFYAKSGVINNAFASAASYGVTERAAPLSSISANDLGAPGNITTASSFGDAPRIIPKQTAPTWSAKPATIVATNPSGAWQWPAQGQVKERFGKQASGIKNEGITIAAPQGSPIRAAQSGEVAYIGNGVRDYGNMVILRHADGAMTSYAHAADITVTKGQHVAAGSVIGHVGTSGGAKTPQLHFALHEGSSTVDPLTKLPSQVAAR